MLDEVLVTAELGSVIATDTAVMGAGRSVIEAIDREVHHSVVRVFIQEDLTVGIGDGLSLLGYESLVDEVLIIQVTLIHEP